MKKNNWDKYFRFWDRRGETGGVERERGRWEDVLMSEDSIWG